MPALAGNLAPAEALASSRWGDEVGRPRRHCLTSSPHQLKDYSLLHLSSGWAKASAQMALGIEGLVTVMRHFGQRLAGMPLASVMLQAINQANNFRIWHFKTLDTLDIDGNLAWIPATAMVGIDATG